MDMDHNSYTCNMVANIIRYIRAGGRSMRRLYCPWCNRIVSMNDADQIKCVNGRGIYRTEIYAHRSCYEKWRENNERKTTRANDQKDD